MSQVLSGLSQKLTHIKICTKFLVQPKPMVSRFDSRVPTHLDSSIKRH